VRVARGVTTHGFALNVSTDLSYFDHIIPCGITDASVTSMQRVLGTAPVLRDVEDALTAAFASVFDVEIDHHRDHSGRADPYEGSGDSVISVVEREVAVGR
jgi:lipoate-protein ligase B